MVLLSLTLSLGILSTNKNIKAAWGATSLVLLTTAWITRNAAVWIGTHHQLTSQAILLAYAERLIDRLVPATSQTPAAETPTPQLKTFDWSQLVTDPDTYPHLLLLGKTGAGKSWLAERLIHYLGESQLVITPHRKPRDFQGFDVVGAGRNYTAIGLALRGLEREMQSRYERYTAGDESYPFLNVVIDEFPAIAAHTEGAADIIKDLAREARKVKMRIILISQGDEVKTLGIEGEGSLRECFTFIRLKGFCEKYAKQLKDDSLIAWLGNYRHPCLVEDTPAITSDLLKIALTPDPVLDPVLPGVNTQLTPDLNTTLTPSDIKHFSNLTPDTAGGYSDPFSATIDTNTRGRVISLKRSGQKQEEIIQTVWGVTKGTSKKYQAALEKYRQILNDSRLN